MNLPTSLQKTDPGMRRYYLGIGLMSVAVAVVVGITVVGNTFLRHDYELETQITEMKNSIESYVTGYNKLPEVPLDAGIKETKGVEYKKISDTRYSLCAEFRSKSSGYSDPGAPFIDELTNDVAGGAQSLSLDNVHYSDGETQGMQHEKGTHCMVYEPYKLSDSYLHPYTACAGTRYKNMTTYTLQTVDTTREQLKLTGSKRYDYQTRAYVAPEPITYTYTDDTKFFNYSCQEITPDELKQKTGSQVYYYSNPDDKDATIKVLTSYTPPTPGTRNPTVVQ